MMTPAKKPSAQDGRVLILVMIFMFTLSAFWIIALSMTGSELSFVGSRKTSSQRFYDAEAGAAYAIDKLHENIPPALTTPRNVDVTATGITGLTVTVQSVHAAATDTPQQEHEFDPPAGSGSGVNTVVARRYAVTSAAGGKIIQAGVYRVVPK